MPFRVAFPMAGDAMTPDLRGDHPQQTALRLDPQIRVGFEPAAQERRRIAASGLIAAIGIGLLVRVVRVDDDVAGLVVVDPPLGRIGGLINGRRQVRGG